MNRELKAVLEVYTRKIRTFIDTQISRINTNLRVAYEHLVSRTSKYPVNYNIADRTIWDSEHLLTALTAFSARKISNGSVPNDGIPDGTSLARLICSSNSDVTKIVDDTTGWTFNNNNMIATLINLYPNCNEFILGCKSITTPVANMGSNRAVKFVFTGCESVVMRCMIGQQPSVGGQIYGFPNGEVHFYGLKTTNQTDNTSPSVVIGKAYFHDYEKGVWLVNGSGTWSIQPMFYIYIGCKGKKTDTIRFWASEYAVNGSVKDVEIREGARQPITLQNLNGLTAENIVNHIFEKLADNSDGDPITINIGSTNLAKLTDEQKAIAQNKNYTLA